MFTTDFYDIKNKRLMGLSPELVTKLYPARRSWYLANRGIERFLRQKFTKSYVDHALGISLGRKLNSDERRLLRSNVFRTLRRFCTEFYFIGPELEAKTSRQRLNSLILPLDRLIKTASELKRDDFNALTEKMTRMAAIEPSAKYCVACLGVLGRILENYGALGRVLDKMKLAPGIQTPDVAELSPDESIVDKLFLDEEAFRGFLYLLVFMSDSIIGLDAQKRRTRAFARESDIIANFLNELCEIYSVSYGCTLGRGRIIKLFEGLLRPILPLEYSIDAANLARRILRKKEIMNKTGFG